VQLRPWVRRRDSWDAIAVQTESPYAPVRLRVGETLRLHGDLLLRVDGRREDVAALWHVSVVQGDWLDALLRFGRPIQYSYAPEPLAMEHHQTLYAGRPGSAETPSAGRHLTWELLLRLGRRGVAVADLVLHTGLSSTQDDQLDATQPLVEEWFEVPPGVAGAVHGASRVIAVGTSVVRALETAAVAGGGRVVPMSGWTDMRVGPERGVQAVDGLLTGLHEAGGSHLELLRAFLDDALLDRAYAEAIERGYLWHEFGDAMLVL
jgi:S-adenosylmethionine:tRNA ribosyltransferase-isomerase